MSAPRSAEELLRDRRRVLGPSLGLAYRQPLDIVRGEGAYLVAGDGRRYLDLVNNVCHVGHCHPRVVEALRRQAATLNTNTRYLNDTVVEYARRLCASLPDALEVCYLVCSGSEANDLALRLARCATDRRGVIAVEGGYHGNLTSLIEISHYKLSGPGGMSRPPYVAMVPMPDGYRGRYRDGDGDLGRRYAAHVSEAAAVLVERGHPAAAFICESLLGCGGQIEPPKGYLAAAFELARGAGAVAIADEVQVGFGRVGDAFWGFELQKARPDVVTLGKPIGNGHPLAAVVTTREIAAAFDNGMEYFNTYGGNPVSCAVGLAVLDVIEEERLQERAARLGAFLLEGLRKLATRHAGIGDVRGRGLFLGVELVDDRQSRRPAAALATNLVEAMKERGFLLSTDGPDHNVVKIKPPLVIERDDLERLVGALDDELGRLEAGP